MSVAMKANYFFSAGLIMLPLFLQLEQSPNFFVWLGRPLAKGLGDTQAGKAASQRLDRMEKLANLDGRSHAEAVLADPGADYTDLMGGDKVVRYGGATQLTQVQGAISDVSRYGDARAAAALGRALNRFGPAAAGVREKEIDALSKLHFDESCRALAQFVGDPFPSYATEQAAAALGRLGPAAAPAGLKPVADALRHLDSPYALHHHDYTGTAWAFGDAIAAMGGIDELTELLQTGGVFARRGAAHGLGASGDRRAFGILLGRLPRRIDYLNGEGIEHDIGIALGKLDASRLAELALNERYDTYLRLGLVDGIESSPDPKEARALLARIAARTKDPEIREEAAKQKWSP
jgi:HEAT repeat protein